MKHIIVKGSSGASNIYIQSGIFRESGKLCMEKFNPKKIHIITDSNLEELYLDSLVNQLINIAYGEQDVDHEQSLEIENEYSDEELDLEISYTVIPAGETYKNIETLKDIYESLAENQIGRNDLIIALGGGVVGDIGGFAAATYGRGTKLCQIPTTLLAQVDSSVGGKCGVDLPQGKNLIGAFYQPGLVLVDPELLQTLENKEFENGVAEIIKYGFIAEPLLLEMLKDFKLSNCIMEDSFFGEENGEFVKCQNLLEKMIIKCISIKQSVVDHDEQDRGMRMILNFGHTIGHAIETLGEYTIGHGEAVSIGMTCSLKMFPNENTPLALSKLTELQKLYNLPNKLEYDLQSIFEIALLDKKIQDGKLNFIIIKEIGEGYINKIDLQELAQALKKID